MWKNTDCLIVRRFSKSPYSRPFIEIEEEAIGLVESFNIRTHIKDVRFFIDIKRRLGIRGKLIKETYLFEGFEYPLPGEPPIFKIHVSDLDG